MSSWKDEATESGNLKKNYSFDEEKDNDWILATLQYHGIPPHLSPPLARE